MGMWIWDIGCRESGKCMWTCENGTLCIGRVCTHTATRQQTYTHNWQKTHSSKTNAVVATGRAGDACGNVNMGCGHVNMGHCVLKGLHNAYGNVNMGHWLPGEWETHVEIWTWDVVYWESVNTHSSKTQFSQKSASYEMFYRKWLESWLLRIFTTPHPPQNMGCCLQGGEDS